MRIVLLARGSGLFLLAGMLRILAGAGEGKGAEDRRAASGSPPDLDAATDQARPVGHVVHPDPVWRARALGHAHAVVQDGQEAFPAFRAQADLDPPCFSVGHGIVHGLLRDAKEVPLGLAVKPPERAIAREGAGGAEQVPDIESQGREGGLETALAQTHGTKTAGHVAGLADGPRSWPR